MEKIIKIHSKAIALPIENIDTDQIIPARYLKATERIDFGKNLFYDWRYDNNDNKRRDFVLNKTDGIEKILIAGNNFGCGSSREHAVWALYDFGFRIIVSSFFADIFRNNALNNGILPIQVTDVELEKIFKMLALNAETNFIINLPEQLFYDEIKDFVIHFKIDSYKKECLLNGLDDILYLLNSKEDIIGYEKKVRKLES